MPSFVDETRVLILAGGASRRMGTDKARSRIGGQTLLGRALDCAKGTGLETAVAGRDRPGVELPEGIERCPDGAGEGPVAGILGAASRWPRASWLVIACDLPLLTADLLHGLIALARRHPRSVAVVPEVGGRIHPLCAWYSPPMIDRFRAAVATGTFGLTEVLATRPDARTGDGSDAVLRADAGLLGWSDRRLREELLNCNRPEDLELARRIARDRRSTSREEAARRGDAQ